MMRLALCLVGALIVMQAAATNARAGVYSVHFCLSGGTAFDNRSWMPTPATGYAVDNVCPDPNDNISVEVPVSAAARIADNTSASLTFIAPAGTTIGDFKFDRVLEYSNPVATGTHALYETYILGGIVFAGIGDYDVPTVNRLKATGDWYAASQPRRVLTKASFRSLAGYRNDATALAIRAGCFPRGTPCSLTGGVINNALLGASVDLIDDAPPAVSVEAFGLLAGGQPAGTEPVRFAAADNAGIRRAEILDVTDPANPRVVASEDYAEKLNDRGAGCSFRLTRPCPNLAGETISAAGITGGRRQISLRATDVAGNQATSPPTMVNVVPPFDRGRLNGTNATETGKVEASFVGTRRKRRTVRYRARARIRGRVLNAGGQPIGNAIVHVLRRDERRGATWRPAGDLRTDANGRFSTRIRANASRLLQFGWPSHVNDPQPAASARLTLRARASGTLSVTPRHIRRGNAVRFRAKLSGYGFPRRGLQVALQALERRRWRTIDTKRTNSKGVLRYRYCCWRTGGRATIPFRARILTDSGFPYEAGSSNVVRRRVN